MPPIYRSTLFKLAACGAAASLSVLLAAGPPASSQPADVPSTPLLQQLSRETQQLYQQSRHSMVRVKLPAPQWLENYNQRQEFLSKWGPMMDPAVRRKLMEQQERDLSELHKPASQPAEKTAAGVTNASVATQPFTSEIRVIELPRPADAGLSLYAVGVLVDDQGHAAFPMFVEKKSIGDAPLPALTGDGVATTATFVGSDARTNLTVLQLATHSGTPVTLGNHKPQDGVLMLSIAPDGGARLVVWNNQHPEPGLAVLTDGSVSGFGFDGHFLGASTAKPIVDQLISFGEVRRAELGVLTMEVDKDDPLRRARPELGTRPAIRIVAVMKGSAAESAGIRADDLVLSIGGEAVGDAPTFAAVIATRRGQTILRVLRSSQTIDLTVNLQPKS